VIRKMLIAAPMSLLLAGGAALAQDAPPPARPALTPLKVQLVLSRHLGEKKISSLPNVLWVTANDRRTTNLRMGVEVPIPSGGGTGYGYRSVGTNIDCSAVSAEGAFSLTVTLSDSSIHFDPKQGGPKSTLSEAPAFRTFTSNFSILLRDGQMAQYTSATDPVSGEVKKVDVTLNS
jgi:hypothetical protein